MTTLADFTATTLSGTEQDLSEHLGSVVLVVNTASKCGLTPQYEGLQALHERFGDRGLLNGEGAHPLYQWLTGEHELEGGLKIPAGDIEWNFGKFLLGRDGQVLRRWSPQTTPEEIADDIEAALGA
ncbi:glutathione peroxidase [Brachybacterium paraconglomeratum]|uniref:glutathione peroxidase n=1 Tax=Brachybacterium paraconglomeratum TaxID=173362 RepID=UPI003FD0E187